MTSVSFLGAAGSVTGSKFLVETSDVRVLVDCGLYQGAKDLRLRNWQPLPVGADSINAVVLTHAHLDHSGYLPLLARSGFRGEIFCTPATRALCEIVLPDSARLQEEEARHANKLGYSKHSPALPLYTERDAHRALKLLKPVAFDRPHDVAHSLTATFRRAGHILGSATVEVKVPDATVLFSGDLGRESHPILRPPEDPISADAIVVESTYGDREHEDSDIVERLARAVSRTIERGGVIVIPAFAVDRTEIVLLYLRRLMRARRIRSIPIYVDSPMALAALDVYRDAHARNDPELREELEPDAFDGTQFVAARTVEQSKQINHIRKPATIISASGMATGGRVLHHLAHRLPDPRNTVILPGFQVPGTRGHALAHGASAVKIHGEYVPVKAEIVHLSGLSAHADPDEIVTWLGRSPVRPATAFVVHGEPPAAAAITELIRAKLDWRAVAPSLHERVTIAAGMR